MTVHKQLIAGVITGVFFGTSALAMAQEDPTSGCRAAIEAYPDDLQGALEEARWCVEMLEQQQQDTVVSSFKDQVGEYQGGQVERQNAMGISNVSRTYKHDGSTIRVQQMNASSDSNPFGALGALAQFGAGRKVRLAGHSGTLIEETNQTQIMLTLKTGGMLNFESNDADAATLTEFATTFLSK